MVRDQSPYILPQKKIKTNQRPHLLPEELLQGRAQGKVTTGTTLKVVRVRVRTWTHDRKGVQLSRPGCDERAVNVN